MEGAKSTKGRYRLNVSRTHSSARRDNGNVCKGRRRRESGRDQLGAGDCKVGERDIFKIERPY